MERKGIATEKGNVNRQIAADNKLLKEIKARITRLYKWTKEQAGKPEGKDSIMAQLYEAQLSEGKPGSRYGKIQRRKAQGLQDRYLYDYTFANDNGQNPVMEKAHAYVEHWKEAYRDNTGLLLFGDVGTGKSFFAGCIANALLDRDVPVLMTNFPSILNRLTGVFAEDRAAFIASLDDYSLLVIDDLGVERNTEYAMEQMFTVIDSRYRSKKPLIVTTNLKLEEIKNPPDLAHARIYDRILERCAPVLFSGKNFREEGARATKAAAKEIVSKG